MAEKPQRLQKYLASCGICSRRKAEEFIQSGRVTVNGITVTAMGSTVTPEKDRVTFDGKEVIAEKRHVYYLLNKPPGFVTTVSDPQGRPVVVSLLKGVEERVFPVGRLDLDTEGALLLTNDGDLAQKIQHPRFTTQKTYEALVTGVVSKQDIKNLETGIYVDGKKTAPAKVRILAMKGRNALMEIRIHEGRKHQVKKMFAATGHPVQKLKRTAYGKLRLGTLQTGSYIKLKSSDLKKIFL